MQKIRESWGEGDDLLIFNKLLDDWIPGKITEVQNYDHFRIQFMIYDEVYEQVVGRSSIQIRPFDDQM